MNHAPQELRVRNGGRGRAGLPAVLTLAPLVAVVGLAAAALGVSDPNSRFAVTLLGGVGIMISLVLAKLQTDRSVGQFLLPVMLLAAGVRLLLFALIHQTVGPYVFAPDQGSFELLGQGLLDSWQGRGPVPSKLRGSLQVGFPTMNAVAFLIFGPAKAAVAVVNIFLMTWCAIPVYYTLASIVPNQPRIARTAVWLTLFFPSLLLWSVLNVREAPAIFLISLVVMLAVRFQRRRKVWDLVMAFVPLALLAVFREYLTVIVGIPAVAGIAMGNSRRPLRALAMGVVLMSVLVVALQMTGAGGSLFEEPSLQRVEYLRQDLAFGAGSAYGENFDVSSPVGALLFLPVGLVYFLFAPFPWSISGALQTFTLPEVLLWYLLVPAGIWGAILALRHDARSYTVPAAILMVTTVAYAMVEGNVGTAYRHRAQIMPLAFVFCAVGIQDMYAIWRLRREARLSVRQRVAARSNVRLQGPAR